MNPDNHARSNIILQRREMLSYYHARWSRGGIHWIRGFLGVAALLGLLLARIAPSQFPSAANHASSIRAVSGHDQRPRFNFDETKWSLSAEAFPFFQIVATSHHIALERPSFSSLESTGLRYNRPPPPVVV